MKKIKDNFKEQKRPRPVDRKIINGQEMIGYPYHGGVIYVRDFKQFQETRSKRKKYEKALESGQHWGNRGGHKK